MTTVDALRINRVPAPIRVQVVDNLRQAIVDRRFAPGQRLIERELVELTGVSRTSIREALRELAAEGLVKTIPNKGTVVASVSREEAANLYQVRSVLEGLAGRLFVENATDEDRRRLVDALRMVESAAATGASVLLAKDHFYHILFVGGGNEELRILISGLDARISLLRSLSLSVPGRASQSISELRDIVDAVLANDVEAAAKACSRHVELAGAVAQQLLAGQEQGKQ